MWKKKNRSAKLSSHHAVAPGGVTDKRNIELLMACILLGCFYVLSRKAAGASALQKQKVVVVDPGHGGADPGMVGVGGLEEKGINLEIALLLKERLQEMGYQVLLTREADVGLYEENSSRKKAQDLEQRVALMRETAPELAVSIHQNSFQDPRVSGPQVFYYENSLQGKTLAEGIQEQMNAGLQIARPRVAKGNTSYYLLKKSPCTVVIVECGFLTNPEEAARLQTEEYQKKAAEAIARGIADWLAGKAS